MVEVVPLVGELLADAEWTVPSKRWIQAFDDLRWHGRHEPLTGTVRKWIGAVIILVAVLLVGELLFA